MTFADGAGFLSEDVLRTMLMEQMKKDRWNQAGQHAAQGIQSGIQGGIQLHQQQQQFDESQRRWDAKNDRDQGRYEQEMGDLRAAAGLRARQESERQARDAVPGAISQGNRYAEQYDKDAETFSGGVAEYENHEKPDYTDQEILAIAEETGLPPNVVRSYAEQHRRSTATADAEANRTQQKHDADIGAIRADIGMKEAQAGKTQAVTGVINGTGSMPPQKSVTEHQGGYTNKNITTQYRDSPGHNPDFYTRPPSPPRPRAGDGPLRPQDALNHKKNQVDLALERVNAARVKLAGFEAAMDEEGKLRQEKVLATESRRANQLQAEYDQMIREAGVKPELDPGVLQEQLNAYAAMLAKVHVPADEIRRLVTEKKRELQSRL